MGLPTVPGMTLPTYRDEPQAVSVRKVMRRSDLNRIEVASFMRRLRVCISMRVDVVYCSSVPRTSSGFGRSLMLASPKVSRNRGVVP